MHRSFVLYHAGNTSQNLKSEITCYHKKQPREAPRNAKDLISGKYHRGYIAQHRVGDVILANRVSSLESAIRCEI